MNVEAIKIAGNQVRKILNLEERHFLDLKSKDVSPAKLTKAISGFGNAGGGELYVGIDENDTGGTKLRNWRGFDDQEDANGHLQIFEALFPLGQYYSYSFLSSTGEHGHALKVEINKTREIVKSPDGTVYIRRGAQNLPLKTEESLARLRLDKGIQSFETETLDVELERITNSTTIIEFILEVVPSAEPAAWLKKQMLIRADKPTVAAILLFSEEPQTLLPKRCEIKIYRYKTSSDEGTRETLAFDPVTIDGALYAQIKAAVARTVELVEGIQKLGPDGFEAITYPFEALHEILTNAVLIEITVSRWTCT
jgi:ATP-dependent DNA helicase RecG